MTEPAWGAPSRVSTRISRLTVGLLLVMGGLQPLSAQRAWTLVEAPQVDLWFHGLAVVGVRGFGPLPLYDPDYAGRIHRAKDSFGVSPTALDRQAERFRAAFEADSSFEVLHFVPLYFAAADRAAMLEALRAVARQSSGIPALADPRTRFGAAAVAAVLRRPDERRTLGAFVEALDGEWREFYGAYWATRLEERARRVAQLQADWDARFASPLGGYLRLQRLDRGIIFVSPALGADGRIFAGDPADRTDNLVAVRLPESRDAPDVPLYAAVRELCYPAVRRAVASRPGPESRIAAERGSSDAAVRCGAQLLRVRAPELLPGYRRAFAPDTLTATFEAAYPLDAALDSALRQLLQPAN
jgi:hypothetical protein